MRDPRFDFGRGWLKPDRNIGCKMTLLQKNAETNPQEQTLWISGSALREPIHFHAARSDDCKKTRKRTQLQQKTESAPLPGNTIPLYQRIDINFQYYRKKEEIEPKGAKLGAQRGARNRPISRHPGSSRLPRPPRRHRRIAAARTPPEEACPGGSLPWKKHRRGGPAEWETRMGPDRRRGLVPQRGGGGAHASGNSRVIRSRSSAGRNGLVM